MIAESIKCMTPLCSKGGDPIQELNVDKGKGSGEGPLIHILWYYFQDSDL